MLKKNKKTTVVLSASAEGVQVCVLLFNENVTEQPMDADDARKYEK